MYQSSLFPFRQVRVAQGHRDRLDNRGNCTKAWAKSKKEMEKTATQATNFISTIEKPPIVKVSVFFLQKGGRVLIVLMVANWCFTRMESLYIKTNSIKPVNRVLMSDKAFSYQTQISTAQLLC